GAAEDTASKPMYAKYTTDAPGSTPDQPYLPHSPVFSGMNGVQFSRLTYRKPQPITSTTMTILIATMTLLSFADSWTPRTSIVVRNAMRRTAGRLTMPSITWPPAAVQAARSANDATAFVAASIRAVPVA